jgi:hypothetical protein
LLPAGASRRHSPGMDPFRGLRSVRYALRCLGHTLAGGRHRAALAQSAEAERRRPRRHRWRGASSRVVALRRRRALQPRVGLARRTGRGSRGLQGLPRLAALPLPSHHGAFSPTAEAAGLHVSLVHAARHRARAAAGSAPCSQPDGMPPAGGRPDRSHGSAGLRHRPPRPWDTFASWPPRDLRPVRTPPLAWGNA